MLPAGTISAAALPELKLITALREEKEGVTNLPRNEKNRCLRFCVPKAILNYRTLSSLNSTEQSVDYFSRVLVIILTWWEGAISQPRPIVLNFDSSALLIWVESRRGEWNPGGRMI